MAPSVLYLALMLASTVVVGNGLVFSTEGAVEQRVSSIDKNIPDNWKIDTPDDIILYAANIFSSQTKYLSLFTFLLLLTRYSCNTYLIRAPPAILS